MNSVRNQYLATICANIPSLYNGMHIAWYSPVLPILLSEESPLATGPITVEEASVIASMYCIGGACGALLCGLLVDRIGRKYSILLCGLMQLIAWALILVGSDVPTLYISRWLAGTGGGGAYVVIPSFVAEISNNKIRGTLGSLLVLTTNIGYVVTFILGAFFSYNVSPTVGIVIGIIFIIWMIFLPETPLYLYSQQKIKAAESSAAFYNYELNTKDFVENKSKNESEKAKGVTFSQLCEPSTRKALIISITLLILSQYCGIMVFISYASQIFSDAGIALNPNIATIIVGCIQLIASYSTTLLVDRAGRKFLLCVSSLGTGLAIFGLGMYAYLKELDYDLSAFTWIPVICVSGAVSLSAVGMRPVPYVVASELLPQNMRGPFVGYITVLMWMFSFATLQYYAWALEHIKLQGCMLFFGTGTFIFLIFTLIFVPETKGKSFGEISRILAK